MRRAAGGPSLRVCEASRPASSCACERHPAETGDQLVGRADAALYAANQAGRGRACWQDGTGCWPVEAAASSSAGNATTIARARHSQPDASFARVCRDLRRRMDEIGRAIKAR